MGRTKGSKNKPKVATKVVSKSKISSDLKTLVSEKLEVSKPKPEPVEKPTKEPKKSKVPKINTEIKKERKPRIDKNQPIMVERKEIISNVPSGDGNRVWILRNIVWETIPDNLKVTPETKIGTKLVISSNIDRKYVLAKYIPVGDKIYPCGGVMVKEPGDDDMCKRFFPFEYVILRKNHVISDESLMLKEAEKAKREAKKAERILKKAEKEARKEQKRVEKEKKQAEKELKRIMKSSKKVPRRPYVKVAEGFKTVLTGKRGRPRKMTSEGLPVPKKLVQPKNGFKAIRTGKRGRPKLVKV